MDVLFSCFFVFLFFQIGIVLCSMPVPSSGCFMWGVARNILRCASGKQTHLLFSFQIGTVLCSMPVPSSGFYGNAVLFQIGTVLCSMPVPSSGLYGNAVLWCANGKQTHVLFSLLIDWYSTVFHAGPGSVPSSGCFM